MKTLISLRAAKPRKRYKSDEAYLRAVYRKNKDWINRTATYKPTVSMERSFVNSAMDYVRQGKTARQAANILASSAAFAGKNYRGKVNIYNVITQDKKLYSQFKSATKLKKKSDFDIEKLKWSYDLEAYEYEGLVIDVKNSPFEIVIMNKNDYTDIYPDIIKDYFN